MRKHLSKALALTLAMSSLASVSLAEGSVLNVWCWNDEFQSRFNAYYPEVKEVAEDKSTTTLNDGTIVKWTINPNADNNYQNKLDEALLAQESAADDDKIDMFLIEADYALKYVDSPYTLDVRADIGLTDDELAGAILKDLGAHNIADDHPSMLEDLSLEEVIAADPDYIFVTTMGDEQKALDYLNGLIQQNPAWSELSAVKEDRYIVLPKDLFHYKPNNRWGESYQYLGEILYPQLFHEE